MTLVQRFNQNFLINPFHGKPEALKGSGMISQSTFDQPGEISLSR